MAGSNYPPGVTGNEPEIVGWPDTCEECGRALKGPEAYGVEIVQFTGGATICGDCYARREAEWVARAEAEAEAAPKPKRETAREIADRLATKYHARVVQCSSGGAEALREAYGRLALRLRTLADRDAPRVTREGLRRVFRQMMGDAALAHRMGPQYVELRYAYQRVANELRDDLDAST